MLMKGFQVFQVTRRNGETSIVVADTLPNALSEIPDPETIATAYTVGDCSSCVYLYQKPRGDVSAGSHVHVNTDQPATTTSPSSVI